MKRTGLLASLTIFTAAAALGYFAGSRGSPPLPGRLEAWTPPPAGQGKRIRSERIPRKREDPRVTPVVLAVAKAAPSVVNIQVNRKLRTPRGVVLQKIAEASGVIVDDSGLCITNWHVVSLHEQPGFTLRITLRSGETLPAKVLSTYRKNDLALLLIEGKNRRFRPITMGDSDDLMIGETVIAIGNPRGQANTVTAGVLSAVNRKAKVIPPGERFPIDFDHLLQTDAAINPGNSGGALLDIHGNLIGINTLVQKQAEGINFAIPVNRVKEVFVKELLSFDNFDRFWTGLRIRERNHRLLVERVVAGGPAALAGIRPGDSIVAIQDEEVRDMKSLTRRLITFEPGEVLPLKIERGTVTTRVKLRLWSKEQARTFWLAGFTVEEIDPRKERALYRAVARELAPEGGLAPFRLLRITHLQPDGPAADLGLRLGEVLLGFKYEDFFGREYVQTLPGGAADLLAQLEMHRGRSLRVLIYRRGEGILGGDLDVR